MKKRRIVFLALLYLVSLGLILYPFLSNYLYEHQVDRLVEGYQKEEKKDHQKDLEEAMEYNRILTKQKVKLTDPFLETEQEKTVTDYMNILNVNQNSVIGIVRIPSIDVKLPIYHGTTASVLEKGVGHMFHTSFPLKGESVHAVLTGHTGLNSAKLFTDLTMMKEGDYFFVEILGEIMAYRVDQITVVDPDDIRNIVIVPGENYCTLVTCTPYGVNSHRLLVRGKYTEYEEKMETVQETKKQPSKWMHEYKKAILFSLSLMTILLLLKALFTRKRKK